MNQLWYTTPHVALGLQRLQCKQGPILLTWINFNPSIGPVHRWMTILSESLHEHDANFELGTPESQSHILPPTDVASVLTTRPWPIPQKWIGTSCMVSHTGHNNEPADSHDDVIKWKHFPRYWPFERGIQRSPVNSPHKGQWRVTGLLCGDFTGQRRSPLTKASDAELWCFLWSAPEKTVE